MTRENTFNFPIDLPIDLHMDLLFHQLIDSSVSSRPSADAISYRGKTLTYANLQESIISAASGLLELGVNPGDRVAIYLPKQEEMVISMFAISRAGGIFVPVNPILKSQQVSHILSDCSARFLITSKDRAKLLIGILQESEMLEGLIIVDSDEALLPDIVELNHTITWGHLTNTPTVPATVCKADQSVAILYTSGSTGRPKGVVLSHRNLTLGAKSVCQYLNITHQDRILALLPFSFDYGLNQLTTSLYRGACAVLMNYLLPQEVTNQIAKDKITGLAAVPPLWTQLAMLDWPVEAQTTLRYITNSGGAMPMHVLDILKEKLPSTNIFLMYGLTEAFRSTYLPPEELQKRPNSIGKAIPYAEIAVVKPDGTHCAPGETGELVHLGPLVASGYWNNPEKTAKRFKPLPGAEVNGQPVPAVWSGDLVNMDQEGYLTFVGREDDMIKTSGYRVSPTEIEETLYDSGLVRETAVFGVPHPTLGQAIVAIVVASKKDADLQGQLLRHCKQNMPLFMVPQSIEFREEIPKTNHGKLDRSQLSREAQGMFSQAAS